MRIHRLCMKSVKLLPCTGVVLALSASLSTAAFAQSEGWLLGPGSRNDSSREVVPTNCETAAEGSITCDTELKSANDRDRSPARPYYNPFND